MDKKGNIFTRKRRIDPIPRDDTGANDISPMELAEIPRYEYKQKPSPKPKPQMFEPEERVTVQDLKERTETLLEALGSDLREEYTKKLHSLLAERMKSQNKGSTEEGDNPADAIFY